MSAKTDQSFWIVLLAFVALASVGWLQPGDLGIRFDLANAVGVGTDRSLMVTSASPVSVFGRVSNPTYGLSNYGVQVFLDTNRDGWPTAADESSWSNVQTVAGWSVTSTGLLFQSSVLTTNLARVGSNYIVRVWGMNQIGQMSSDTNQIYWSSQDEATGYGLLPEHWTAMTVLKLKPGSIRPAHP